MTLSTATAMPTYGNAANTKLRFSLRRSNFLRWWRTGSRLGGDAVAGQTKRSETGHTTRSWPVLLPNR